ncbi:MAG TPA: metallophosphoesterase [Vicinamibacterales bacterium]|nr:metallophosphoesterase [Vicinamibacterales bacterium]
MFRLFVSLSLLIAVLGAAAVAEMPQSTAAQNGPAIGPPPAPPPAALQAVRFAVIGDNGTGDQPEFDVARQMVASRAQVPFDVVLMLGDNLYGRPSAREFDDAFARPYKPLLDAGVRFHAILGNHDAPDNRLYPLFGMDGQRYYTWARENTRFFGIDTNRLDDAQMAWLENALKRSLERWKIVYFHHAIYSGGTRHGSNIELRVRLEPLFVRYGVNVVFSGHDHIYQRFKPRKGITYFVEGASGKLRKGINASAESAAAFDQDQSFMLVEIAGAELTFRTITRTGRVVDAGVIGAGPTS